MSVLQRTAFVLIRIEIVQDLGPAKAIDRSGGERVCDGRACSYCAVFISYEGIRLGPTS